MVEERLGSIFFAKTENADNNPVSEARPAVKSHTVDRQGESRRPTSGATSPDLAFEIRRPDISRPEMREPHRTAGETASYRDFRRLCDDLLAGAKRGRLHRGRKTKRHGDGSRRRG